MKIAVPSLVGFLIAGIPATISAASPPILPAFTMSGSLDAETTGGSRIAGAGGLSVVDSVGLQGEESFIVSVGDVTASPNSYIYGSTGILASSTSAFASVNATQTLIYSMEIVGPLPLVPIQLTDILRLSDLGFGNNFSPTVGADFSIDGGSGSFEKADMDAEIVDGVSTRSGNFSISVVNPDLVSVVQDTSGLYMAETDTIYTITLSEHLSNYVDSEGVRSVESFFSQIDPVFVVPATFLDANQYQIFFSAGVDNQPIPDDGNTAEELFLAFFALGTLSLWRSYDAWKGLFHIAGFSKYQRKQSIYEARRSAPRVTKSRNP